MKFHRSPQRVVCMTEESVETLYLLGLEKTIVGVSAYVKRPAKARTKKKISSFISANVDEIVALKPDLVLGYSDIQKDIARELLARGLSVWISNHQSLAEILAYITQLASLFGKPAAGQRLVKRLLTCVQRAQSKAARLPKKPRVYFEEWDDPMIFGIEWVSELIECAGGVDVFKARRGGKLARDRFTTTEEVRRAQPDILFSCWCGKRMKRESFENRFAETSAMKTGWLRELKPEIYLQPGPAPFLEGLSELSSLFGQWSRAQK